MSDPISAPHRAHPDCWCKPTEVEPGVWVHSGDVALAPGDLMRTIGWHHRGADIDLHLHVERLDL